MSLSWYQVVQRRYWYVERKPHKNRSALQQWHCSFCNITLQTMWFVRTLLHFGVFFSVYFYFYPFF
jgi:hypothetical protein